MNQALPHYLIRLDAIKIPKRVNVTQETRDIVSRFHKQEFTHQHVYHGLLQIEKIKDRIGLKESVRTILHKMYRDGDLEIVTRGGCGVSNVYRNTEKAA